MDEDWTLLARVNGFRGLMISMFFDPIRGATVSLGF